MIETNTLPGEGIVDGWHDPETNIVSDGLVVPRPVEDVEAQELHRAWGTFRTDRNARLFACDWTQAADAPVDRAAWAAYRQALRDLPANTADPRDPQWPSPPA
ncbi:MAG: tail fiber assembly protein [Candidatus Limnocylindrus sp.]